MVHKFLENSSFLVRVTNYFLVSHEEFKTEKIPQPRLNTTDCGVKKKKFKNNSFLTTPAHFLGFEFLVRNEENILLSHKKRGKFEESLNSLYLPNFKFYCILIWQLLTKFSEFKKFLINKPNFASQKPF